jgi:DNA-binding transcriptional LysR family regulator
MAIEWDDLKFMLAAGRHGSLSGAARALGVNHATVSRRIAAAEARLGARLFDRLPSGLRPTAEGTAAIAAAERVEAQVNELGLAIAARDRQLGGTIRVTAPDLLFQTHLPRVFAEFGAAHPEISLVLKASNELLNLHQRQADVAVRVSKQPEPSLFGRRVSGQAIAFFVARTYLERSTQAFESGDVPLDYVGFSWWGGGVPDEVLARFPKARVSIVVDDMLSVRAMVKAGMGVGRMPCILASADTDLVAVPGLDATPYSDVWVLTHPDLRQVERIRVFMRFIAEAISKHARFYEEPVAR